MVKSTQNDVTPKFDDQRKQDAAIISNSFSSGRSHSKDNFPNDELIVSLADAYENKRARQVNEWESRQHVARAF
jgi:hypothetical protein